MRKFFYLFLFVWFCTGLSSCSPSFEDASYRCRINGKEFTASGDLTTVTHDADNAHFVIRGTRLYGGPLSDAPYGEMEIRFSVDTLQMGQPQPLGYNQFYYGNNVHDKPFRSSGNQPGTVTIVSYDPAGSVQGIFQLTAYADDGDSLVITDGAFDLAFTP